MRKNMKRYQSALGDLDPQNRGLDTTVADGVLVHSQGLVSFPTFSRPMSAFTLRPLLRQHQLRPVGH